MPDFMVVKAIRPPVTLDDARRPETWRNTSRRLLASARLLWKPLAKGLATLRNSSALAGNHARTIKNTAALDHFGAFHVIAGLAVENALKARILERALAAGDQIRSAADLPRVIPMDGAGHNLVRLADRAKVQLSASERLLLERLTTYVRWAGRYPVSKVETDHTFVRATRDRDMDEIDRFIVRIGVTGRAAPRRSRRRAVPKR